MTTAGETDGSNALLTPGAPDPVRVLVVDDHVLFAGGLAMLLGPVSLDRIHVVGTAKDAAEALDLFNKCHPDVVLVDLAMPGTDGICLIRKLRRSSSDCRIAVLSGTNKLADIDAALDAGATAFLPKDAEPAALSAAVLAIHSKWCVLPDTVFHGAVLERQPPQLVRDLSDQQRELLVLVARGLDTTEIAETLFISERTAKRRLADLLGHMGVKTRAEAAALAGQAGLV